MYDECVLAGLEILEHKRGRFIQRDLYRSITSEFYRSRTVDVAQYLSSHRERLSAACYSQIDRMVLCLKQHLARLSGRCGTLAENHGPRLKLACQRRYDTPEK